MRTLLVFVIFISSIAVKAQTFTPLGSMDYMHSTVFGNKAHSIIPTKNKNWFLSSYGGISTSFIFFNGGNATVFAAPLGLQLNRRLDNNLYAFAGISAAPAYINFNHSFLSSRVNKGFQNNSLYKSNSFDLYGRAELGLMYVNDAKTFSVSGSIGIERNNYPLLPYQHLNTGSINPVYPINR